MTDNEIIKALEDLREQVSGIILNWEINQGGQKKFTKPQLTPLTSSTAKRQRLRDNMTCKDCLYFDVCKDRIMQFGYDFDENMPIPEYGCGVAHGFKNKADFAEVVRCKNCVYFEEQNDGCSVCGRANGLFIFPAENDFCSYGKRI